MDKISNKILNIFLISIYCLVLLFVVPSFAYASQAYVGGYFTNGYTLPANKVIAAVSFPNTNSSVIQSNNFLSGVLSVAGGSSSNTPTGYVFQSLVALYNNGGVVWAPQVWALNNSGPLFINQMNVGSNTYVGFYGRMDVSGSNIVYKLYVYSDFSSIEHDAPLIYTCSSSSYTSSTFLVGSPTVYINGVPFTMKYFQIGVESPTPIQQSSWRVLITKAGYYNGGWTFLPAKSCLGSNSYISYNSSSILLVGGSDYSGANIDTSNTYNDSVMWKWSGSTISSDVSIWTGGGYVSDTVSKPYN
jgi:hypothetical protein